MIGAVADGLFANYADAVSACVAIKAEYLPNPDATYEEKYNKFCALYNATLNI